MHLAHQPDPAPRRARFLAGDAVGRTVRKAQPAPDAARQLVGVHREPHHAPTPSGSRPGFNRPWGSNRTFTRRLSSTTAGATIRAGAATDAFTTPTPISATNASPKRETSPDR